LFLFDFRSNFVVKSSFWCIGTSMNPANKFRK